MITVIIPIYNSQQSLSQCIESVLNQTYSNFELILIDDGSTDRSLEICKRFEQKDKRIRVFSKPNSGVSFTRNVGISKARGEWICFIDSDDTVNEDYLQELYTDNPNIDMIWTGIKTINIKSREIIKEIKFDNQLIIQGNPKESFLSLLKIGYPYGKAFKSSILKDNNITFPTNISFHEDHVFVFEYLKVARAIQLKESITYNYLIDYSGTSLSNKRHEWRELYQASLLMFSSLEAISDTYHLSENELKEISTFCYLPIISACREIYNCDNSSTSRKNILRQLLTGTLKIREKYHPTNKKDDLIKHIIQYFPISIIDLFFTLLNYYKKRKR